MAAAPTPVFTETFAVHTGNYGDFIRLLRKDVIGYCSDRRPNIVQPVLPPQRSPPTLWFHILLRTATTTSPLTLAVRVDNLYLVGFRTPGPAGVWWEFGREGDARLINGSRRLGFGDGYPDLVGHRKGLDAVTLGRAEMAAAVDALAQHGTGRAEPGDPYALPKSKLAKLVIMLLEGVRFHTVYGTVDKKFDGAAAKMTELEGKQVREWEKISERVREHWAVDPTAKFSEMEVIGIKDRNDAARIVAIVKDKIN